ncbi:PTS lactose/cellobiose transporter subunit IIA [Erysipelothrix urinaevulpis]|uniref:PTS lactose/cellobiose transporter subunit IIA n=1 Tax=Erysipelothrix urinaevulpis TaxID=2683717 RepID=UPI001356A65A|nr:PTS lactose/cellobiose transporter subunit IIA [Erysipelothrix urinaevulpis]
MDKTDVQMLGFEIVAYAGEAKSKLMVALNHILDENYESAKVLFDEAQELIRDAHQTQMDMLAKEAQGIDLPYSLTMVHGQDHLMGTVLLRDVIEVILVKKISE